MDDLDLALLTELVKDSGRTAKQLGDALGVGASLVYSRLRRLAAGGYIKRFTVDVDETKLGYGIRAMTAVRVAPEKRGEVVERLLEEENVVSVSELIGRYDLLVQVKVRSLEELDRFLMERFAAIDGVLGTETFVQLTTSRKDPDYRREKAELKVKPRRRRARKKR